MARNLANKGEINTVEEKREDVGNGDTEYLVNTRILPHGSSV